MQNQVLSNQLQEAKDALDELVQKYQWRVWATEVTNSGWYDGVKELLAIVEVRRGKIIKIKGGGYGNYFMVESESGGWVNLSLLEEVRNFDKAIYQIVGMDWHETFDTLEELQEKYTIVGTEESEYLTKELRGKPILEGFAGPMYNGYQNGIPVIRYETPKAREFYSA